MFNCPLIKLDSVGLGCLYIYSAFSNLVYYISTKDSSLLLGSVSWAGFSNLF